MGGLQAPASMVTAQVYPCLVHTSTRVTAIIIILMPSQTSRPTSQMRTPSPDVIVIAQLVKYQTGEGLFHGFNSKQSDSRSLGLNHFTIPEFHSEVTFISDHTKLIIQGRGW